MKNCVNGNLKQTGKNIDKRRCLFYERGKFAAEVEINDKSR